MIVKVPNKAEFTKYNQQMFPLGFYKGQSMFDRLKFRRNRGKEELRNKLFG